MSLERKLLQARGRREHRVRKKLRRSGRPRVSVKRSLNNIYAQLIDDTQHKTIASCSTLELKDVAGSKKERAFAVGKELGQRAVKAGITTIVFDRGRFLYHGRVAALAEGLKEGGLRI